MKKNLGYVVFEDAKGKLCQVLYHKVEKSSIGYNRTTCSLAIHGSDKRYKTRPTKLRFCKNCARVG